MKKYAIVFDTKKCLNCKACTVACKFENHVEVGDDQYRIWVDELPLKGKFPNLAQSYLPSQCQQCENPACVHVCPTKASYQTEDGVVLVDSKKCILCKYCMTACPYDARFENHLTKAVDKCTFCYHRLPEGRPTACVETCPTKVRVFVDLEDQNDETVKQLALADYDVLKPEKGTKPKLYYLR